MSRADASNSKSNATLRFVKAETTVSAYDRLSSFLIAALIIMGFLATILTLIWWNSTFKYDTPAGYQLVEPTGNSGDDDAKGFEDDAFEPGVDDFPEVETPQLAEALEAVAEAVSNVKASLADVSGDATANGAGGGYGAREGGSSGEGTGVLPEYKRWKINYQAEDIEIYKRQLSDWEIDVGVLRRDSDDVYRVRDPAGELKVINSSRQQEGNTLYFAHVKQRMMRWDKAIASQAGVDVQDVNMIQFYSTKARSRILEQEAKMLKADGRSPKDIRETIVRLTAVEDGFDFVVEQINY